MELEAIDWPLRQRVEALRRACGNETSAHAFQSLYIWKKEMELRLLCGERFYAVRFGLRGENSWFFPCGEAEAVRAFVEERLAGAAPCRLYYAGAQEAARLEAWFPGRFEIRRAPEDDEYIYNRQEQLALRGRSFRHQRNDLHRAMERHDLQVSPIAPENLEQTLQVLSGWKEHKHRSSQGGLLDVAAGETLIRHIGELGVSGVLVSEGDSPVAVAAGYPLTDSVFDLCVCQNTALFPEVSTFARHALLERLGDGVLEINAEEDLGIEGLRSLKEGMRPARKLEMYACIQKTMPREGE